MHITSGAHDHQADGQPQHSCGPPGAQPYSQESLMALSWESSLDSERKGGLKCRPFSQWFVVGDGVSSVDISFPSSTIHHYDKG